MRCKNCGWENKQDCVVCENCGFSIAEHTHQHTETIIPGLNISGESNKIIIRCPNGHIYDSSIYGNICPLCPTTFHIETTTASEEKGYTRRLQERHTFSESPVVGFLYSISRRGKTEYWPLHIGKNTVSRSNDNDIVLLEKSISFFHADICINQTNNGLKASIYDNGSKEGTMVNGEELTFDRYECRNGDVIEIGNYQLYLIIIDSDEIGLKISDKFIETENGFSNDESSFRSSTCIAKKTSSDMHNLDFNPYIGEFKTTISDVESKRTFENNNGLEEDVCNHTPQERNDNRISFTYETPTHLYGIRQIIGKIMRRFLPPKEYNVFTSIFAPAEVMPKMHMIVQVYLHLYEETEKVKKLAMESDKNAERRDYIPLQCKLKKGDKVDVQLNIYGETLLMSDKKSVVWQGSFTKCSFDYFVPKDIDVDELSCVALLTVNGIPVGEMQFITMIVDTPRNLNPEIIAHKYNKVFVSYAHKDESKVKSFHEGLKLAGIEHFFDRAYLQTGDIFPQVIQDYINAADLFVLFWSKNALKSDYVDKERKQALERAFPQVKPQQAARLSIYPMSIEPRAELPSDMKDNYHFGEI